MKLSKNTTAEIKNEEGEMNENKGYCPIMSNNSITVRCFGADCAWWMDTRDDCTLWYVNEYYEVSGLPLPLPPPPLPPPGTTAPWQTRIASFKLPGCVPR